MKFTKAKDIWLMTTEQIKKLPVGQWVYAGDKNSLGRFYGVRSTGVVVVAWKNNAKNNDYFQYCKTLNTYAKG
jgi:hypothetical protein